MPLLDISWVDNIPSLGHSKPEVYMWKLLQFWGVEIHWWLNSKKQSWLSKIETHTLEKQETPKWLYIQYSYHMRKSTRVKDKEYLWAFPPCQNKQDLWGCWVVQWYKLLNALLFDIPCYQLLSITRVPSSHAESQSSSAFPGAYKQILTLPGSRCSAQSLQLGSIDMHSHLPLWVKTASKE